MNLRQKYKRTKQKLEALEKMTSPIHKIGYDRHQGRVETLRYTRKTSILESPYSMQEELFYMKQEAKKRIGETAAEHATIFNQIDNTTGEMVVMAELKIVTGF